MEYYYEPAESLFEYTTGDDALYFVVLSLAEHHQLLHELAALGRTAGPLLQLLTQQAADAEQWRP